MGLRSSFYVALFSWIALLFTARAGQSEQPEQVPSAPLAILGATLIDGTDLAPIKDSAILLSMGKIVAVGKRGQIAIPTDAQVINAQGKWIVPGLIDAHVHFFQSAGLFTRPDVIDLRNRRSYAREIAWIQRRIPYTLSRYICSGVTSVVDLGGPFWTIALKQKSSEINKAPRVTATGPLLATYIPKELQTNDPSMLELGTPEKAREEVRNILKQGAELIKIWFIQTGDPTSQMPSIRAAISEAHAKGARVVVHATEMALARLAVGAGADILAHSVSDELVDTSFLQLLKERNVIYIPTLMVSERYREVLSNKLPKLSLVEKLCGDPEVIATWAEPHSNRNRSAFRNNSIAQENLRRVAAAGVIIASGSDAGNIGTLHGPALHRELELMVQAGLSPQRVLLTATRDAAKVSRSEQELGTLETGKLADLLILNADPLGDIQNLSKISKVIKGGYLKER
jgi:imidazolonepropionase-like amidohydrolase